MKPASRLAGLGLSPIRIVSDGAPPGAIPLGLGEPGWPMPGPAAQALAEVSGVVGYGPNTGLPEAREAVARFYGATPEEVLITCGSQEALFVVLNAWVGPGDRVLVPDPGFVAYPAVSRLAGAESVTYPLAERDRFRLDPGAIIERLDTPGLKAVVINHPSNPTGGGASLDALRAIADACQARDLLLLSDEVYRDLYFDDRSPSLRDASSYGVVLSSVSKGWGSPGLRVGWAVGEERWVGPARIVHAYAVTAAARPSQIAAARLLDASEQVLAEARRELGLRWEALAEAMSAHLGVRAEPPDGSFYHWIELPEAGQADGMAFCLRLRDEAGVVLIPGIAFGERGRRHARLSFSATPEQVREGVRRLVPFWRE